MVLLTIPFTSHNVDAITKCQMPENVMLHLIVIILN